MPRIVDLGVTRYDWLPLAATLTTPSAPKLSDISGGSPVAISPYVVTTTDIKVDPSDQVTEKGITDTSNAIVPTIGNYSGNLVLFRDYTSGVPTANDPMDTFSAQGVVGWLIRRLGKAASVALAVDDLVDVFLFMTDNPNQTGGKGDGYLKLEVPLLQQGTFYQNVALVA